MNVEYSRRMGRLLGDPFWRPTPSMGDHDAVLAFRERVRNADRFEDLSEADQKTVLAEERKAKRGRPKLQGPISGPELAEPTDEAGRRRLQLFKAVLLKPEGSKLILRSDNFFFWDIANDRSPEGQVDEGTVAIMTDVSSGARSEPKPLWAHLKWMQGNVEEVEEPVGAEFDKLVKEFGSQETSKVVGSSKSLVDGRVSTKIAVRFDRDARDADGDGRVQDGTQFERPWVRIARLQAVRHNRRRRDVVVHEVRAERRESGSWRRRVFYGPQGGEPEPTKTPPTKTPEPSKPVEPPKRVEPPKPEPTKTPEPPKRVENNAVGRPKAHPHSIPLSEIVAPLTGTNKRFQPALDHLNSIVGVHRESNGRMPLLDVESPGGAATSTKGGLYYRSPNSFYPYVYSIEIRVSSNNREKLPKDHPAETIAFFHEMGHRIDLIHTGEDISADMDSPTVVELIQAARETASMKNLEKKELEKIEKLDSILKKPETSDAYKALLLREISNIREHTDYLFSNSEVWARLFSQYAAWRLPEGKDRERIIAGFEQTDIVVGHKEDHWEWEEIEALAELIEKHLIEEGMMYEQR